MLSSYYTDMPSIVICADGRLLSYYDGRMNRDSWKPMIWAKEVLRDELEVS